MGGGKRVAAEAFTHPQRVKLLYKTILKLHRGLPLELRALGDQYAKDEFKRHKEASNEQSKVFMVEWTNYAIGLAKQLGVRGSHTAKTLGQPLSQGDLDQFNDEQVYQLYELHEAATNPQESNPAQDPKKET